MSVVRDDDRQSNDHPERDAGTFPVPDALTSRGRINFIAEVRRYGAWLERRMAEDAAARPCGPHLRYTPPEFTDDDVDRAVQQYEGGRRPTNAAVARRFLAPAFVTVSSVGVGVLGNFLHSPLQVVAFLLLIALGLVGLGLTWTRVGS